MTEWNHSFWLKQPNIYFFYSMKIILYINRIVTIVSIHHQMKNNKGHAIQQVQDIYLIQKHTHWIWRPSGVANINTRMILFTSLEVDWKLTMVVRGDLTIRVSMGSVTMLKINIVFLIGRLNYRMSNVAVNILFYFCLSLIHIWRCRRSTLCRSRWSPYH